MAYRRKIAEAPVKKERDKYIGSVHFDSMVAP